MFELDAKGLHYKELNKHIRSLVKDGEKHIVLRNINGQRYIGGGINKKIRIDIYGTPGNDLGAFMDGPVINVYSNGQDAIANTMNSGRIVVHGDASDVLSYGMRGGTILIKGSVGYRVGINIKEYMDKKPVIVIGGRAGNFCGEYMAGGILIILGVNRRENTEIVGDYLGTGMHGGVIYIRGDIHTRNIGKEVKVFDTDEHDLAVLNKYITEFSDEFGYKPAELLNAKFIKLLPVSKRPYGRLYVY